ncbi:MAG: N-acetylmuramoyl-L-alanine amidase [Steroidobacteraceae bacterium]
MRDSLAADRAAAHRSWRVPLAVALVLLLCRLAPVRAAEVRSVTLAASAHAAVLEVHLSQRASFKYFTLEHPDRVVIDLSHTRRGRALRLPRASGIVAAVRAGIRPHGGLRLVVQLRSALAVHTYWSAPRRGAAPRLIVSMGARGSSGAHASAGVHAKPAVLKPVLAARVRRSADRDVIVAVDAGHGGQDPGAIGPDGMEEKAVTLAIARKLAKRIDAEPGMRAVLTRNRDVFLSLRERLRRARVAHADLFVSVHADSVHDPLVSGASVYILSEHGATDEAARWLAERENSADRLGGIALAGKSTRLASVLLDLTQSASISASMAAARGVVAALARVVPVRTSKVQQAGFVVLKSPDIPSMLVETAYISDPADERRLRSSREQGRIAGAICSGIRHYFERHPPLGTLFARERGGSDSVVAGAAGSPAPSIPR